MSLTKNLMAGARRGRGNGGGNNKHSYLVKLESVETREDGAPVFVGTILDNPLNGFQSRGKQARVVGLNKNMDVRVQETVTKNVRGKQIEEANDKYWPMGTIIAVEGKSRKDDAGNYELEGYTNTVSFPDENLLTGWGYRYFYPAKDDRPWKAGIVMVESENAHFARDIKEAIAHMDEVLGAAGERARNTGFRLIAVDSEGEAVGVTQRIYDRGNGMEDAAMQQIKYGSFADEFAGEKVLVVPEVQYFQQAGNSQYGEPEDEQVFQDARNHYFDEGEYDPKALRRMAFVVDEKGNAKVRGNNMGAIGFRDNHVIERIMEDSGLWSFERAKAARTGTQAGGEQPSSEDSALPEQAGEAETEGAPTPFGNDY